MDNNSKLHCFFPTNRRHHVYFYLFYFRAGALYFHKTKPKRLSSVYVSARSVGNAAFRFNSSSRRPRSLTELVLRFRLFCSWCCLITDPLAPCVSFFLFSAGNDSNEKQKRRQQHQQIRRRIHDATANM